MSRWTSLSGSPFSSTRSCAAPSPPRAVCLDAEIVGTDPKSDLAVLRIKAPSEVLDPLEIGSSSNLKVGQNVYAIGNPFGFDQTLTTGVVSALGRDIVGIAGNQIEGVIQTDAAINPGNSGGPLLNSSGDLIGVNVAIRSLSGGNIGIVDYEDFIQTDAAINPGNSGGPLLDLDGNVVGINTAIFSRTGGNMGIGFAIPADTVKRVVPDLIEHGRVVRPTLGVRINEQVSYSATRQLGVIGVMITEVEPNSSAAQAGLRGVKPVKRGRALPGDIIQTIAGKPVRTLSDIHSILTNHQPGEDVIVEFLREGSEAQKVTLTLQSPTQ